MTKRGNYHHMSRRKKLRSLVSTEHNPVKKSNKCLIIFGILIVSFVVFVWMDEQFRDELKHVAMNQFQVCKTICFIIMKYLSIEIFVIYLCPFSYTCMVVKITVMNRLSIGILRMHCIIELLVKTRLWKTLIRHYNNTKVSQLWLLLEHKALEKLWQWI